jgi:hypothetical protein
MKTRSINNFKKSDRLISSHKFKIVFLKTQVNSLKCWEAPESRKKNRPTLQLTAIKVSATEEPPYTDGSLKSEEVPYL